MQVQPLPTLHRPFAKTVIALLTATTGGAVWADEPSPYYIGLTETVTHNSNVYGIPEVPPASAPPLPADFKRSDTFSSTGLVGGFDQNVSRQHFYGSLKATENRYAHNKELNNFSYDVNAGWDWATIERLSGSLVADSSRSLANQSSIGTQTPTTERNILATNQFTGRVRWGGDSPLNLDGSFGYTHITYSATPASNSTQRSGGLGISYAVGPTLRLGLVGRVSKSDQPNYQTAPGVTETNTTDGRNLDLTADWQASPQTGLNARISQTKQTNSAPGASDFSGLTGAISGHFAPTSKLTFNAAVSRDAGVNSMYANVANPGPGQPTSGLSQNSTTATNFSLGANYAVTAKISATAGYQYLHNKVPAATGDYADDTRTGTLGITYAIARAVSLACNASRAARDVSSTAGYSYSTNIVGCSAQVVLR